MLLKYFFIEWENVTSEEINRNFKNIVVPNEDESLYTLWNLIDFIKNKYVRYGIEDVIYFFPNYPYFLHQKISNVSFNKEIKQVLKKIGLIYNVKVVNKTSKLVIIKVENERANKWPDEDSLFLIAHVLPGKAKCVRQSKL